MKEVENRSSWKSARVLMHACVRLSPVCPPWWHMEGNPDIKDRSVRGRAESRMSSRALIARLGVRLHLPWTDDICICFGHENEGRYLGALFLFNDFHSLNHISCACGNQTNPTGTAPAAWVFYLIWSEGRLQRAWRCQASGVGGPSPGSPISL